MKSLENFSDGLFQNRNGNFSDPIAAREWRPLLADRRQIQFEQLFLFPPLVRVLLAQRHQLAHHFRIVPLALGLGINLADVVGDVGLVLLEPLDALDEGFEARSEATLAGGWCRSKARSTVVHRRRVLRNRDEIGARKATNRFLPQPPCARFQVTTEGCPWRQTVLIIREHSEIGCATMAYPVFLSSTSRDLQPYRDTVRDAIAGLDGFEVVAMEDFGARDDNPRDLCAELVAKSQIYVGVMGHYYGSCPPDVPTSFTELEYEAAADANLPRLIFAAPDDFAIPATLRESDDSFNKQRAFRERVMQERVAASFASAEQLASAVTIALSNWREQQKPEKQEAGLAEAPASPVAPPRDSGKLGPNPYRGLEAFHKEDAARFFGREALIERLWARFLEIHRAPTNGEASVRLLAILGASGSGKSSVAQAGLLAELEKRPLPGRVSPPAAVLTPDARPLESLAVALARLATSEQAPAGKAKEFEKILRDSEDGDGLRYLAEHMLGVERAGIILLIDQFEEVYSTLRRRGRTRSLHRQSPACGKRARWPCVDRPHLALRLPRRGQPTSRAQPPDRHPARGCPGDERGGAAPDDHRTSEGGGAGGSPQVRSSS